MPFVTAFSASSDPPKSALSIKGYDDLPSFAARAALALTAMRRCRFSSVCRYGIAPISGRCSKPKITASADGVSSSTRVPKNFPIS